jgi:nicotinate-nucleotide adenylyltransferase
MVALALGGRQTWSLELRELERGGVSYTVDTLEGLRKEHPGAELFLIVGGDSLGTFRRWRRAERILALASLAVVPRAGEGTHVPNWGEGRVHVLRAAELSVSSTQVRGLLSQGKDVTGLVPAAVVRYIERQGLYASPRGRRQRRTS